MTAPIDIVGILKMLPHRFPFLLVDRIVTYKEKESITAYKNITFNEPFFQGHFPARPIMPGVLILEALAQAGGLLGWLSVPPEKQNTLMVFMGADKIKFRRPVMPGDKLELKVDFLRFGDRIWRFKGQALVDNQLVAEAEITAGPAPIAQL